MIQNDLTPYIQVFYQLQLLIMYSWVSNTIQKMLKKGLNIKVIINTIERSDFNF